MWCIIFVGDFKLGLQDFTSLLFSGVIGILMYVDLVLDPQPVTPGHRVCLSIVTGTESKLTSN